MNPWQIEKQLAFLAAAATWEDSPNDVVLTGGAVVSADVESNYLHDGDNADRFPFARVELDAVEVDPDNAQRIDVARFQVHVACSSEIFADDGDSLRNTDAHGGEVVEGGTRDPIDGAGSSTGRGIDEVVGRLIEVLGGGIFVDATHALQGEVLTIGPTIAVFGSHFVKRVITIAVYNATAKRFYHPPIHFTATALGGGQVALAWTLPPSRWDRLRVVVRSVAGSTPPATATAGSGVTLGTDLATSVTVSGLSAGARSFSAFFAYDETHSPTTTEERYSGPASATVTVT